MGIESLYREDVVTVEPDTPVEEVAWTMFDRSVGSVVVTSDGELDGIVTDRDLMVELLAEDSDLNLFDGEVSAGDITASDVMTTDPVSVAPGDEIPAVLEAMQDAIARRIPVVDGDHVVGIVALDDLLVHVAGEYEQIGAQLRAMTSVIRAESPD